MSSGPTALERCVGDVPTFAREVWGRRSSLHHAPERFDDLFHLDAVDDLLASSLPQAMVDLISDGEALDRCTYRVDEPERGAGVQGTVDPFKVLDAYATGATVAFRSLHHMWAPLGEFSADMERQTGLKTYAQAFLTPPGDRGLRPHGDHHEVFVIQLAGDRHWWVDDLGELTLSPGDVLYMPIGMRHSARSDQAPSLHVSITVLARTYRDVLAPFLERGTPSLDTAIPLTCEGDPAQIATELKARIGELIDDLTAIDVDTVADRTHRRSVPRLPDSRGRVVATVAAGWLTDEWTLVPTPDLEMRVEPGYGGQVVLRTPERIVSMPDRFEAAFKTVALGSAVRVGALPALTDEDRIEVARRLVDDGLVTPRQPRH